ncbi:3-oxoacyl-[acyl-carrier protein] reductase [Xaviernesmea oryzae]|uniref:3-oxoacyl-[acyl-carrier protein] reductase n=1 Tax=Xaviernesmea oryzae TaxID=464029 RepID=A0A1X7FP04_9HYPH|nr:3-oxoacyl-ACP reductase FabG [Xaviernesmea oryzae]SMF56004.1 3-oxoacyl-[acyl-carrier protein] reductase [Xaviernesmea oryzae]
MENSRPVAVISGGSSGIGFASAKALLENGFAVALFGQRQANIEQARTELSNQFGSENVHAESVNLRDPEEVSVFFAETSSRFRRIDALVCCAGISPKLPTGRTPLAEIPLPEWADVMAVNLTGTLLCLQAVLPGMVERRHGRIVLIGSLAGRAMSKFAGAGYAASKAALASLARSIVSEYANVGITANTICPGRIVTPMIGDPLSSPNQAALAAIPTGRLGTPEDIARAVVFLTEPEAGFINGAIIDINGGQYAPA